MSDSGESRSMTVDEAWDWYTKTRDQLDLFQTLGRKYWAGLPWDVGPLSKERKFKTVEAAEIVEDSGVALGQLDDFAVLILYSAFETTVRDRVLSEVAIQRGDSPRGILTNLIDSVLNDLEQGPSAKVLDLLKSRIDAKDANVFGNVSQVRNYRNWVAHGRRDDRPLVLDPKGAFERLKAFLFLLDHDPMTDGLPPVPRDDSP